jgi:hypothetical protein
MITTRSYLDFIFRELREVGYEGLQDDQKEICDAFDAGKLSVIEDDRGEGGKK